MKVKILLSAMIFSNLFAIAQDDKNLVRNPGFEAVTGKLKKTKQINYANHWVSPTGLNADLYSSSIKEGEISVPDNLYGREAPAEGNNYAGLVIYSYGDKTPRTYIMTELLGPLKAGLKYCVKFDLSLADNSKYAVNNIGAHVSKKPFGFDDKRTILDETHVKHSKNKVFNATYGWETVCQVFTAGGGEKYLTIGNFSPTKDTKNEKTIKQKGSNAKQYPIAYYYIDNVSVFLLDSIEECQCEQKAKIEEPNVIVDESYATNNKFSLAEKIKHEKVYFDYLSTSINQLGLNSINKIVDILNNNKDAVIEVHAHCSSLEMEQGMKNEEKKDLAKKRGEAVIKQLTLAGISENRLMLIIEDDKKPDNNGESEAEKARNRRVEFLLRK